MKRKFDFILDKKKMEFYFDDVEVFHGGSHLKLVKIVKSKHKEKKWDAHFKVDGEREKVVSFGATGYEDYTQHKNEFRKKLYLERHGRGREHWSKPDSPGALSRWILWNKPGFRESISDFKRRFHLG